MKNKPSFVIIEELIIRDEKLLFTTVSYIVTLIVFVNLTLFISWVIGTIASIFYFLINGVFLGRAFFEKEDLFSRFMLGNLLLIIFLGLIGWAIMIIFGNLDTIRSALVLCTVATVSSVLNKWMKRKNAKQ